MKIVNKTSLNYQDIGKIIDKIKESNTGNTAYYGKIELAILEIGTHKIEVTIRYLKRYVEWYFKEIESRK